MRSSTRKQSPDISRIVGILILEIIAALLLLNLMSYAKQQRSASSPESYRNRSDDTLVHDHGEEIYPYPKPYESRLSFELGPENSVPKLAFRRYNNRS